MLRELPSRQSHSERWTRTGIISAFFPVCFSTACRVSGVSIFHFGGDVAAGIVGVLEGNAVLGDLLHKRGRAVRAVAAIDVFVGAGQLAGICAAFHHTGCHTTQLVIGVVHLLRTAVEGDVRHTVVAVVGVLGLLALAAGLLGEYLQLVQLVVLQADLRLDSINQSIRNSLSSSGPLQSRQRTVNPARHLVSFRLYSDFCIYTKLEIDLSECSIYYFDDVTHELIKSERWPWKLLSDKLSCNCKFDNCSKSLVFQSVNLSCT